MPGSIQRAKKMGSIVLLAHIAMSAPLIASSGRSTGVILTPSFALISLQKASRLLARRTEAADGFDVAHARTAISCAPACQPEPRMPTWRAFLRARCLTPSPFAAPTRMRCITPSGMIASGSPFSTENSSTRPT